MWRIIIYIVIDGKFNFKINNFYNFEVVEKYVLLFCVVGLNSFEIDRQDFDEID